MRSCVHGLCRAERHTKRDAVESEAGAVAVQSPLPLQREQFEIGAAAAQRPRCRSTCSARPAAGPAARSGRWRASSRWRSAGILDACPRVDRVARNAISFLTVPISPVTTAPQCSRRETDPGTELALILGGEPVEQVQRRDQRSDAERARRARHRPVSRSRSPRRPYIYRSRP